MVTGQCLHSVCILQGPWVRLHRAVQRGRCQLRRQKMVLLARPLPTVVHPPWGSRHRHLQHGHRRCYCQQRRRGANGMLQLKRRQFRQCLAWIEWHVFQQDPVLLSPQQLLLPLEAEASASVAVQMRQQQQQHVRMPRLKGAARGQPAGTALRGDHVHAVVARASCRLQSLWLE